jgi:hypothetical protein
LLIVVLFASLAWTKLTYATECMDGAATICGGDFGGSGEGYCDKNPEACSGSNEKYGCNNQGDCSVPAPVQAKMDWCPPSSVGCQDDDGTKYYWDANGNFVITSKDGVVTVWDSFIGAGGGGDLTRMTVARPAVILSVLIPPVLPLWGRVRTVKKSETRFLKEKTGF